MNRGRNGRATLFARLPWHVALRAHSSGELVVDVQGYSIGLGKFSARAADQAQNLGIGLALRSFEPERRSTDKQIHALIRRLARHGLLEYRVARSRNSEDLVVIEPQVPDYWPRMPQLSNTDTLVLSRFAYMRRRSEAMILESPRAGALFKICDPAVATLLAILSTPQQITQLRRQDVFPGVELLALLVDSRILFEIKADSDGSLRRAEGDDDLMLWDFHDFLFHTRSTEGRHASSLGGVYPYANIISPLPAIRPSWPGEKVNLEKFSVPQPDKGLQIATLLRQRHSTRSFDDEHPITATEISHFLDNTARVVSEVTSRREFGNEGPLVTYAVRPYPSAGACYELELYLAVDRCEGLARGFYHYDAGEHVLVPIAVRSSELEALLTKAAFAMAAPNVPQILITITARFGRVSWKYKSIAYSLIQKDVGVLIQTFYMMATSMRLGGCAIGIVNIDLFANMTGIELHVEGPVGQFALGRGHLSPPPTST
jgi:SagB-type dehydrogenase family enzyme